MPRDYWEVIGTFDAAAGEYTGRWFDEKFVRADGKDGDAELKPERLWDKAQAEAIRDKCLGKPGIVTEESKPTTPLSPLLYDLTSLQREANSRFGFSAKNTLGHGAGALRAAQGADLSAHRFARVAGGLPRHGARDVWTMLGGTRYAPFAEHDPARAAGCGPTSASSTTPRSPITLPSSRPRRRPRA